MPVIVSNLVPPTLNPPFERTSEKELLAGLAQAGLLTAADWNGSLENTVRASLLKLLPESDQGDGYAVDVSLCSEEGLWRLALLTEWQEHPVGDLLSALEVQQQGVGQLVFATLQRGFGHTIGCFAPVDAQATFYYRYWDGNETRDEAIKSFHSQDADFNEEDVPTLENFFGQIPKWAFQWGDHPEALCRSLLETTQHSQLHPLIERCEAILKRVMALEPDSPPVENPPNTHDEDTMPAVIFSWKSEDNITRICCESMDDDFNSGGRCDNAWYCHFDAANVDWIRYTFDRIKRVLQLAQETEALLTSVENL